MSQLGDVIFHREASKSSSVSDMSGDDMWDDKVLINVYDKAINVAKEEVAKRLAMNTNKAKKEQPRWRVGSKCRATYSADGVDYEATIVKLLGDTCVVSYIGYENEEEVPLKDLKTTSGENNRLLQRFEAHACLENPDDITREILSDMDLSDCRASNPKNPRSRKGKKSQRQSFNHNFHLPPPINSFPYGANINLDNEMPLPPPPLLPTLNNGSLQENQALSTMLLSWYMSGYYTGLYLGQKMAKK